MCGHLARIAASCSCSPGFQVVRPGQQQAGDLPGLRYRGRCRGGGARFPELREVAADGPGAAVPALLLELGVQRGSVAGALVPPSAQVGLEFVEPGSPGRSAEEFFGAAGAGEPAHGRAGQAGGAADLGLRVAGVEAGADVGVAFPGARCEGALPAAFVHGTRPAGPCPRVPVRCLLPPSPASARWPAVSRQPRCRVTALLAYSARLCHICQRSATWIASGAPARAPSAYAPALSRQITAAPGCAFSHASTVEASRSGSMSTTSPVSMLTSTVPYTCPLRRAKSSMPSISGAVAAPRSGRAATSRRIVDECTAMPSRAASRAPARPASSSPNPVSMPVSGTLRRQYLLVRPSACIANVTFGHDGSRQRNRRTRKMISTGRPPAAPSATVREYPPCTRADADPQAGQRSGEAAHDAEITTASPVSSIRCTFSPASCGNSRTSSFWPSSETSRTRTAAGDRRNGRHDTLGRHRGSRKGRYLGGFLRPTGASLPGHADTPVHPGS